MKKILLTLGIFQAFISGLYAHPKGFKLAGHSGPRSIDEDAGQLLKSIGIDAITYNQGTFYQWCDSIIDNGIDTVYYGVITLPSDAGAYGDYTKWYARGDGLVGRYFDWRMSADSMALWHDLISIYTDTLGDYASEHSGLISYRMMDGDSGYNSGVGIKHSLEGLQILYDSLEEADSKLKDGSHYTYCWGSYDYPRSVGYYLDLVPDLDVSGPGAYIFHVTNEYREDSAQAGLCRLKERCRMNVPEFNARGRVYMPLLQSSRIWFRDQPSVPPTLEELRAAHWVALAYGSAWIGYYEYRGHANYNGESNWQGTAGVVEKYANQAPYCLDSDLSYLRNTVGYDGPYNNNDNTYVNLHRVIQEVRKVGPTVGNLTWIDGFSLSEYPRGWVKAVSGLASGDSADFGMFAHDDNGDKYLMVVNRNTGTSDTKSITLTITPGPGTYNIKDVATNQSIYSGSTNSNGELTNVQVTSIPPGGGVLLHLDYTTLNQTLTSDDPNATATYNGRKIVADTFGGLHLVYTDLDNGVSQVWYAYKNSSQASLSGWSKQLIATDAKTPAIDVDCYGRPFIVYRDCSGTVPVIRGTNLSKDTTLLFGVGVGRKGDFVSFPCVAVDGREQTGFVMAEKGSYIHHKLFPLNLEADEDKWTGEWKTYDGSNPSVCVLEDPDPYPDWRYFLICYNSAAENSTEFDVSAWHTFNTSHDDGTYQDSRKRYTGERANVDSYISEACAIYEQSNSVKMRRDDPGDQTFLSLNKVENIGNGNGNMESDEGMIAVWETNDNQILCSARSNSGTWATPTSLVSSKPVANPHTAISWKHGKAYFFATVIDGDNYLWINDNDITGNDWYQVRVLHPNGDPPGPSHCVYLSGKPMTIKWQLQDDANSSNIYTTYNYSGASTTWDFLTTTQGATNTCIWTPQGSHSKCRIKVVVNYTGSSPYDISDYNFTVSDIEIAEAPAGSQIFSSLDDDSPLYLPAGVTKRTAWQAYSLDGLDDVEILVSGNDGTTFTSCADSSIYDSTLVDTVIFDSDTLYAYEYSGITYWTTPSTPCFSGCLQLMAVDTTADTAYSQVFANFIVPSPGGFEYNTFSNQHIMSLNDDGDKIGLVYTAQDPDSATKVSVLYMESNEGLDFYGPDTIDQGCWSAFSNGACCWQNGNGDSLLYSYQLNDTFSTPITLNSVPVIFDSAQFAPVALLSENDTVHIFLRETDAFKDLSEYPWSGIRLIYLRLLESSPGSFLDLDTIADSIAQTSALYDTTTIAPSISKKDSVIYFGYEYFDNCMFTSLISNNPVSRIIGGGSHPQIHVSEGNVIYSYLGNNDSSLIRLWRYVNDTSWVERDTFSLNGKVGSIYTIDGLYYGIQNADTTLADFYIYDPVSEELSLAKSYTGFYPHPYVDESSSEFMWINAYSNYVDSSHTYLQTERGKMTTVLPALYLEADDRRSPYTLFRDTCIHYTSVDVDSGRDSLIYQFPHLNSSKNYTLLVEFYSECDSSTQLAIQVGSNVDTLEIPANDFAWYEYDIPAYSDTMNLAIRRIGTNGFVSVSRIIVRCRSSAGIFAMGQAGPVLEQPVEIPFCLYQPYPNPFGDYAMIRFSLPYATPVSLKVYDVSGRLVTKLVDGVVEPGVHTLRWKGRDDLNRKCASGVYFVRYMAGDYVASKKMVMIK